MIYFDNAATSFYKPSNVKNAVVESVNKLTANPGRSGHMLSQKVAEKIFETKEKLKKFFNCDDTYDVIFTKNCTEALNLSIFGLLKTGDHVITTCFEHNSVLRPLEHLKSKGVEVTIVDCDLCEFAQNVEHFIKENTKLVISTFVSNVTGEVSNIEKISKVCHNHKVKLLVDGAQACGHMKIDINKLDIDMLAFAGHKGLLSLTGVGGVVKKREINLSPLIFGGTGTDSQNLVQPNVTSEDFEAGTVPSISILSLNAGLDFLNENFSKVIQREEELSNYLYNELKKLKFLKLYSKKDSQNVFTFNILDYDPMEVANSLNERFNICVRSGLHCAPLAHKKLRSGGAVRVSLNFKNSKAEIDSLIKALKIISSEC